MMRSTPGLPYEPAVGNVANAIDGASVDGSEPRVVYDVDTRTQVQAHDWSPDGRAILAIRSQEDGTKQIVLVPVAGGAVRVLRSLDWREPMRMGFSPDGRLVAYADKRGTMVRKGSGGPAHRLLKGSWIKAWAPRTK